MSETWIPGSVQLTWTKDQLGTGNNGYFSFSAPQRPHSLVHSNHTGRTGSINSHGWTTPVEEVGQAVGDNATRCAGGMIRWEAIEVANQGVLVVDRHDSYVDGRVGASQPFDGPTCGFDGLVDRLHEYALLGVDRVGLSRVDVEELGIERPNIFIQSIRVFNIRCSVMGAVVVVVARQVEPGLGYLPDEIPRLLKELP
jgi:hypothetical protein